MAVNVINRLHVTYVDGSIIMTVTAVLVTLVVMVVDVWREDEEESGVKGPEKGVDSQRELLGSILRR